MDPFAKLPAPVLLSIFKLTPDLGSLRNLDLASPAMAALFDERGLEITQAVLSSSRFLSDGVRGLIQTVTAIRSNLILSKSLDDFCHSYIRRDVPCEDMLNLNWNICARRNRRSAIGYAGELMLMPCVGCYRKPLPVEIPASTPISNLRDNLCLALHIHNLATSCVHEMIGRCMALQPSHIADPLFRYKYAPFSQSSPQKRPKGEPYEPHDSGPPSWIELQRTSTAFWRLELFFDLQDAAMDSRLPWPKEDITRLNSLTAEKFWEPYGAFELEHVKTIVEYLQDGTNSSRIPSLSKAACEIPASWPLLLAPKEESLNISDCPEAGFHFSRCGARSQLSSPLKKVDFGRYRRLGFYVWERERMVALGVLREPNDSTYSAHSEWFTWESILRQDERDKMDRERLASFPEDRREIGSNKRRETYWYKDT